MVPETVCWAWFLHPNEHPERICSYPVRQFEAELAKKGHFQISKSIFEAKYDSTYLKWKFLFEYLISRTTFIKSIYFFNHSCKTLFSKNVPYFCQLCLNLSCKIQTNPFWIFIRVQKCIEIYLPPHEIPQPWHTIVYLSEKKCYHPGAGISSYSCA